MSMITIFVLIKDSEVKAVSPFLDASSAVEGFRWVGGGGEVYACRVSESAAAEIKQAHEVPQGSRNRKTPLQLLKTYSQSMQKCSDVT